MRARRNINTVRHKLSIYDQERIQSIIIPEDDGYKWSSRGKPNHEIEPVPP